MCTATLGVIADARGRRRHRRATIAVLLGTAAASGALALGGLDPPAGAPAPAASTVLARAPRLGVACVTRACDSVGIAVWLRRPAVSVRATIAGHVLVLSAAAARQFGAGPSRRMFVGYVTPLRAVTAAQLDRGPPADWVSPTFPTALVRLRIVMASGDTLRASVRAPLQPGWG